MLVDGGRYTHENYFSFDPTTWRGYFRSSFSHNVILIDGHGQTSESNRAEKPLQEGTNYINEPMFDYARGTYSGGYAKVDGDVEHTRTVMYMRGQYWVVVDHIEADRPRELQALWHYAPDLQVQTDGQQTVSTNPDEANLRIIPVGGTKWSLQIIKGQTKPVIQGWYSEDYGKKEANATAVYSTKIEGDATLVWVLVPAQGPVPPLKAKMNQVTEQHVKVQIGKAEKKPDIITIPLNTDGIPHIEH